MTLLLGVLLASVAGSVHCAAMCGAFVCGYVGRGGAGRAGMASHVAYNGGRLVSYLLLGVVAGAIGAQVEVLGALAGVARGAGIVAGVLLTAWALHEIAATLGWRVRLPGAPVIDWAKRQLGALLLLTRDRNATARAGILGLVTTLLPCGWLYAFVLTAAATAHPARGAAVMLFFWAGTVPALVAGAVGIAPLLRMFGRRLPVATATLILILGLLSISGRISAPMPSPSRAAAQALHAGH